MKSDEFIREVDEELQQERLAGIWRRYGIAVVAVAVVIVVGTAGYVGWQAWQERARGQVSQAFANAEALAARGDDQAAIDAYLDVADSAGAGPAAVARMRAAEIATGVGELGQAEDLLNSVGENENTDPLLRDAAKLAAISRKFETESPLALVDELDPLSEPGDPFRLIAREFKALALIRAGEIDQARALIASIKDDAEATQSQQRRATELFEALGGEPESAN